MIYKGVVAWFGSKGQSWGSIDYGDKQRVFVHYKNVVAEGQLDPKYKMLAKGQEVEFELGQGHYCDGTQAINVKVLNGPDRGSNGANI